VRIAESSRRADAIPVAGILAIATLLSALGARVVLVLPAGAWTYPLLCPFRIMTGLPCFACGGTRALGALASGRWAQALQLNPLVAASALGIVAAGLASWVRRVARRPALRLDLSRREMVLLRVLLVAAIVINWVYLIFIS
jgi:hypothetical protein